MRKLVEIDPISFQTKEFDHKAIRRSAEVLRDYLIGLDRENDPHGIRDKVLPIVEQALAGSLDLPFDRRKKPLIYENADGLLPRDYTRIAAPFWLAICGMSGLGTDLLKPVHKDGKAHVWMEFED